MNSKWIRLMVVILFLFGLLVAARKNHPPPLRCSDADAAIQKQCQVGEVERALARLDFFQAWQLIVQFSQTDATFAETCHGLTHAVGKKAYQVFSRGKPLSIAKETSYCSYGFYHGFMETLLKDGQPAARAREFCDRVGQETKETSPDARYACFHGIGHGWTNVHDRKLWGDEQAMAAPSLSLCQEVARNDQELLRCATGVFDSISIAYYNQQAGLVMKKDDPLWLCREVDQIFAEACYRDMMPAILWLGNYVLQDAAPLVERFVPKMHADVAIQTLAANSVRYTIGKDGDWQTESLAVCRRLGAQLRIPCISGLGSGMMEFGLPNMAHQAAFAFCRREELSAGEKSVCFGSVLGYVMNRYERKQAAEICQTVEKAYQKLCETL